MWRSYIIKTTVFIRTKEAGGAVAFPAYQHYGHPANGAISSLLGKCKACLRWYFRQTSTKMRIEAHESDERGIRLVQHTYRMTLVKDEAKARGC